MVSVHVSGSSSPGSSPGQGIVLCSWARQGTHTVPFSAQVYMYKPVNLMLECNPSIPSRGK